MAAATRSTTQTGTRLATRGSGGIGMDALADQSGLHRVLVRRLVNLGLVRPTGGTAAAPLFARSDAAMLVRAVRLRRDLGLNYAGAVLACELLARIDELEARLPRAAPAQRHNEVRTWTPTA